MSASRAGFPSGTYFTDMRPDVYNKRDILGNNYGSRLYYYADRADYFVQVRRSDLEPLLEPIYIRTRRLFRYPHIVHINRWQVIRNY